MRLPAWVAPSALALAATAATALLLWVLYELAMWFATVLTYAMVGLFLIGFGLDPTVIDTPTPVPPTGA